MAKGLLVRLLFCLMVFLPLTAGAQRFFNLTAEQVRVDSVLPVFSCDYPIGAHYADSTYTVTIEYPEFIPMSETDVARLRQVCDASLPALPVVSQTFSIDRKQGMMHLTMVPLVYRNGQYQKLVSFMLKVKGKSLSRKQLRAAARQRASEATGRYADHSVLSTGEWAKIRVSSTGIHELTADVVRKAGFTDINKVKIYGYGGGLQPERLTDSYLRQTDDLQEVPTCTVNGRRLFYAVGPVTWDSSNRRVRNPYSQYGYYFLTQNDSVAATVDEETFLADYYPLADDYNTLYEIDDYAWYHGGRNLYDATPLTAGTSRDYTIASTGTSATGSVTVCLSADASAMATLSVNGEQVLLGSGTPASISVPGRGSNDKMRTNVATFSVSNLQATNTVTLSVVSTTGTVRLDYISIHSNAPKETPNLAQAFPAPEYVYHITNQNHHAATAVDMVIIIPTTQKVLAAAQRLKTLHEQRDGLRVRIVPADELYNEFSSGTPDANAYRRYLKMLYDRAGSDADMPRYLLLMGDGAWDNRMLISDWRNESPDDFLLCYESENSYSETDCYVSDDYFCMLDDNEGGNLLSNDKADVAVGRIPARTAEESSVAVDKIERYMNNTEAGAWQNVVCFMGDDGNQNQHMMDADSVAQEVELLYPNYQVKRIMWDAYTRVTSSTGNSFPDATRLILQQMQQGALMMNYSGHGSTAQMSHEAVLYLSDFENASSPRLPLWVTASCDIMPFDGQEENFGETALFNKKGGAIAFFGTTRTVYQSYNRLINLSFTRHVLGKNDDGRPIAIGEAVRQTKNELMTTGIFTGRYDTNTGAPVYATDRTANKLQYTLLGDPALALAQPTLGITVDSINGATAATTQLQTLKAGDRVTISGYVTDADGNKATDFSGLLTTTVRDAREQITCKLNDPIDADVPFVYYDRPNTIFSGSDSVRQGRFSFSFAVPKDISYSEAAALMNLYAVSADKSQEANGIYTQLAFNGSGQLENDGIGPSIYCYLNNSSFTNGGSVNRTPYFVAQLADEDGINATGSGIGHDLQLIIDGDMARTYSLNDYFQYDFGSYTHGSVGYSIPELSYGQHRLLFRAWDVLNNSSTSELTFNVVKGLEPVFVDVECTRNPATTSTTFRIIHDRTGSAMDVVLDVFDISGRHLWSHSETGVSTDNTYTIDWDLTVDDGRRLSTGVYLYRLRIASDGSSYASKAKKLIILTHQ